MYVVDFETEAIEFGSGLAPKPVGVSIMLYPDGVPVYYAFGHPTKNNCDEGTAKQALAAVWEEELLFHHGKFDIGVAQQHWGFPWPQRWHDTMYLIYLINPLAPSMSLKPSATRLLGIPPDEQEAVRDWLIQHGVVPSNSKDWGAHICKAPGDIVGVYGNGDTFRTAKIFEYAYPIIEQRNMLPAYERELKLAPILYEAERVGVRIDRDRLMDDIPVYEQMLEQCENLIRSKLGTSEIDTPAQLAKALLAAGYTLRLTPTGRTSTSQAALMEAIRDDKDLLDLLAYRGACKTLLGTFMRPWVVFSARDGHLHPSWNSVRSDNYGTRTGRLSCSTPNLQNVPTEFDFDYEGILAGFLPLPFMRVYILPDEGEVILAADYNGQEMRLLGHFAEGKLQEIYLENPRADVHQVAVGIVEVVVGPVWTSDIPHIKRKQAKITGFSLIYGAGVPALAEQLGVPANAARLIKAGYLRAMVGLADFQSSVSARSEVKTWGGRIIPVEPPKHNEDGSVWSFNYRLVNHLIQGTAADQTKQSIIEYHERPHSGRFLMTVHDENVVSVKLADLMAEMTALAEAMEGLPGFDVPFIVEMEWGNNWHDLTDEEPSNG
jgi:DNA polymerase I-like protein with 3'-5' exonuclease and polymerase domains